MKLLKEYRIETILLEKYEEEVILHIDR